MRTKLRTLVKCPEQIQKAEWVVIGPGSPHALPIMGLQNVHQRAGEDTEAHREKAMKQTEIGVTQLQTKEHQRLSATPQKLETDKEAPPLQISQGAGPC